MPPSGGIREALDTGVEVQPLAAGLDRVSALDLVGPPARRVLGCRLDPKYEVQRGRPLVDRSTYQLRARGRYAGGRKLAPPPRPPQYSSASIRVSTRTVTAGSLGSG
jgi:hypothetical protein